MRTLWQELLPRLDAVEMNGEARLIASEFVSGPKAVPIRFRLAAAGRPAHATRA